MPNFRSFAEEYSPLEPGLPYLQELPRPEEVRGAGQTEEGLHAEAVRGDDPDDPG